MITFSGQPLHNKRTTCIDIDVIGKDGVFMKTKNEFVEAINSLPSSTAKLLDGAPETVKREAKEIRLRAGRKVAIVTGLSDFFLNHVMTHTEMFECFRALCGYSVHSHTEEIRQGYITIKGGHRAGLCGSAVYNGNRIVNIKNISSINLRIAREIPHAADPLINALEGNIGKLLIVGSPASGKTTLLKDLIAQTTGKQVTVIDSRGEIAACLGGIPQNHIGNADVFDGWNKADGILTAIRTMAPDIIFCDEIGDEQDAHAIEASMNAGVELVATAHAGSIQELCTRKSIMKTIDLGAFDRVVLLKGKENPCEIDSIHKAGDLYAYRRNTPGYLMSYSDRFHALDKFNTGKTRNSFND